MSEHMFFVTGKLASAALHELLAELAPQAGFEYSIQTMPITVAALMTPAWILKRWEVPAAATRIVLPGYCLGDLQPLRAATQLPVERGPRDLRELPDYLGAESAIGEDYGRHDIEIIAEINHAPTLSLQQVLDLADSLARDGADRIDLGCDPDGPWPDVAQYVAALVDSGHRVSIDSLDPREIGPAAAAGADLVLSVNSANRQAAPDWGCTVVAIPDDFATLGGLDETLEFLDQHGVDFRIDPILEPIGMGFADSLQRYWETRRRYPDAEIMMGVGNLTELTDVDSAGVNTLLLGYCQELGIRSVLTTQVINWAQTSVRECDVARRLVHYAVKHRVLPKRLDSRLVMLRDTKLLLQTAAELDALAGSIRDHNYRMFADQQQLHIVAAGKRLSGADPFLLFEELCRSGEQGAAPPNLDLGHAFYLGYELSKAMTAMTLGKQYRQDESLDWGLLTQEEVSHRERQRQLRSDRHAEQGAEQGAEQDAEQDAERDAGEHGP